MSYKKSLDEVRFPASNDDFIKYSLLTVGAVILVASVAGILWTTTFSLYILVGISISILFILNGVYYLPQGIIKYNGKEFSIPTVEENIDKEQLEQIEIESDKIIFTKTDGRKVQQAYLTLNYSMAKYIEEFFLRLLDRELIKNKVR